MSPSLDLFSWSTGPTRGASEGGAFVPSVLASDTAAIGAGRAGRTQTEDGTASVRWEKCAPVPRAERPVRQLSGSVLRKTEDSGDHRGCQKLTPCKTRPPCYTAGRCGSAGRLPPTRVPPLHPPPSPPRSTAVWAAAATLGRFCSCFKTFKTHSTGSQPQSVRINFTTLTTGPWSGKKKKKKAVPGFY